MTTATTTTQNGDFFRLGSFRLSSRSSAKRDKIRKLNNNQMGGERPVVFAVREENGEKFQIKWVQIDSDGFRLVHMGSDGFRLVQIGSDGFRLDQMGSNWFRWTQFGSDGFKLVQIGSDGLRLVHIGSCHAGSSSIAATN